MQNYYNRQLEFDNNERAEFLNYLKVTGKINSNFQPVSNYNSDFLTDKIGQEYNAIKTPQTYFSRKFQGTLKPIDNNLNYYDFYSLGKGGLPFGEYNKNRFYNQKLFTPSALQKYSKINLPSQYINNNNMNNYNIDLNYQNNNFNSNEQNNNNINSRYNNENNSFSNQNNSYEERTKLPISKSMNNLDFQDYKRRLNEREKQLIGNYEDSHKYVETVPNYNNNYIYESNTKNYYPSNIYYNDNNINSSYPKSNRDFQRRENPCKI